MSENGQAETAVSSATASPAAPPAAPPAAAPSAHADPVWLPERLKRAEDSARSTLLRELGVSDVGKARAALEAAKAVEQAAKTEAERAAERIAELQRSAARVAELEAIAKARAEHELSALTEAQRAAVLAIAGDDSGARLRTITALAPTWQMPAAMPSATAAGAAAVAPTTSVTSSVPPAPAAPIVPAASAAPAAAPPPAGLSRPDHKARYQQLQRDNPVAAAHYLIAHQREIYPG